MDISLTIRRLSDYADVVLIAGQRPTSWGTRSTWQERGAVVRFALLHLVALSALALPWTAAAAWWLVGSYLVRMFGVTAGYHRYFSHRAYRLGRPAQFALAFLAQTSGQKGVLWWSAHHRHHHRHADKPHDIHSPHRQGFLWAHVGWIVSDAYVEYDRTKTADLARFPELRWIDRHHWVPTVAFGAGTWLLGGTTGFVWGYLVATVVLYHATFAINSVAHIWGTRRFPTADESRNNWLRDRHAGRRLAQQPPSLHVERETRLPLVGT